MMKVDREQFIDQGYLILRDVIPPAKLEELRATNEILVERQKAVWSRDRAPDDPPGGVWESAPQPRLGLHNSPELIDEKTADAVEFWLHENTLGVSTQLIGRPETAVNEMMMMCNPVRDHGPAEWHRDIHPIDTAPLEGYVGDFLDNGPRQVQWNIPMYDDNVLWVMPGSHCRLNTDEENAQLLANPRGPLKGSTDRRARSRRRRRLRQPYDPALGQQLQQQAETHASRDLWHPHDLRRPELYRASFRAGQGDIPALGGAEREHEGPHRGGAPCRDRTRRPAFSRQYGASPAGRQRARQDVVHGLPRQGCLPHLLPQAPRARRHPGRPSEPRTRPTRDHAELGPSFRQPVLPRRSRCTLAALQASRRPAPGRRRALLAWISVGADALLLQ